MTTSINLQDKVVLTKNDPRQADDNFLLESDSLIDQTFRVLYRVAYQCHLIVNFVLRPKTQGAYVAVWQNGKVLMIRNSYKSVYTLPCGGVGRRETVVDAARRELFEEVDLDLPVVVFQKVFEVVNYTEFKIDQITLFEVHLDEVPKLRADGREVVWLGFRSLSDALKLPLFPAVHDYLLQQKRVTADGY
ncbi:MAG: NUDIX hydrolase [Gammaproteobacteria bacterium]|nr:NUDIX hydrolase [Gammaproteobacteria bacterium]